MTWASFERGAYQAARAWGVQPSEFWAMSPWEWWAEFDAKMEEQDRLSEITGGKKKRGDFSEKEWAAARRRHAEKMKANQ